MHRRTFLQVLGQTGAAACLSPQLCGADAAGDVRSPKPALRSPVSADTNADWDVLSALLEDASSSYGEPWDDATCRTLMKGGYLGNGDLGVHLGGTRHSLIYYLGKNGFHAANDTVGVAVR